MRRVVVLMVALALLLTACGGSLPSIALPTPPDAEPVEQIGNSQIQQIVNDWRNSVPAAMQQHQVKAETIQQATYQWSASLENVQEFYKAQFPDQNADWHAVPNMPGLQAERGFLLTGYQTNGGQSSIVIGAIDASTFGGEGVVIYAASGHK